MLTSFYEVVDAVINSVTCVEYNGRNALALSLQRPTSSIKVMVLVQLLQPQPQPKTTMSITRTTSATGNEYTDQIVTFAVQITCHGSCNAIGAIVRGACGAASAAYPHLFRGAMLAGLYKAKDFLVPWTSGRYSRDGDLPIELCLLLVPPLNLSFYAVLNYQSVAGTKAAFETVALARQTHVSRLPQSMNTVCFSLTIESCLYTLPCNWHLNHAPQF
jgi:hypothetical protein